MFLKDRAVEWEEDPQIALELATAPRLSQLIEEYIKELEKRSDIEQRIISSRRNGMFKLLTKTYQKIIIPKDPRSIVIDSEEAKDANEGDDKE